MLMPRAKLYTLIYLLLVPSFAASRWYFEGSLYQMHYQEANYFGMFQAPSGITEGLAIIDFPCGTTQRLALLRCHIGDRLEEGFVRTRDQVAGIVNQNRRHDNSQQKEADVIRAQIRAGHRFESFAAERDLNTVKWHIDGHDFFWAMSEILDRAKEIIQISGWWLSPEFYFRRPPAYYPEWRLDKLLLKKAQQGVRIYVLVYKEVAQTLVVSSSHTKHRLEELHENIAVMRHPDHIGAVDTIQAWTHHEKICIVDNHFAAVGGLDASFGRWDTQSHPVADAHPTDMKRTLFPGQDYNNKRIKDFEEPDQFASNQLSIWNTGRMPWHDVSCSLVGPVVLDIVQHFIERWNEVKLRKYKQDERYDWLAFPHNVEAVAAHSNHEQWQSTGRAFKQVIHSGKKTVEPGEGHHELPHGTACVQVCRSVSDWSHGVLNEHSIQNAYIQMIRESNHCIYIENQFFISNTGFDDPIKNLVAKALVERISSAHRAGQKFNVVIVIPEVPSFTGDIKDSTSIQATLSAQYRTINRGGHSIYEELSKQGIEPLDHIRFFHLRSYDRINAPYGSFIKQMEEKSGVSVNQAQVALARRWIGDVSNGAWHQAEVKIATGVTGTHQHEARDRADDQAGGPAKQSSHLQFPFGAAKGTAATTGSVVTSVPVSDEKEAEKILEKFERAKDELLPNHPIADSVAHHALENSGGLLNEKWLGTPEEEKAAYISEQLYVHTKLMIVDDRRVIIGSANLNDRSLKGDGDSEIAIVIEDTDLLASMMDGHPYMASRFAATLRRKLWREHLGLIQPQHCGMPDATPTSFMRAAPFPNEDETSLDDAVADPLAETTIKLWNDTAKNNTEIFSDCFHVVPSDRVRTWAEYDAYVKDIPIGHLVPGISLEDAKQKLAQVKGHLVEMPLNFLADQKDALSVLPGVHLLGLLKYKLPI